ncbi:MAG TPA: hypothetical protein VME66_08545 [Candidatus Acidoferrales bacterium]|nr:hypothetical protein [Candidatus Acidoferrales bacterium]
MKYTLVLAGAVAAALMLGGCGHTTPVTSGTATPLPTITPYVSGEYAIPTAASKPAGITTTSTSLYFTEEAANKVAVLTQSATFVEYPLPEAGSEPLSLVLAQDGEIWLTEFGGDRIAQFNTATGQFTECTLPQEGGKTPTPWGIAAGGDGNLWVTDPATNGIWQVQPGCGSFAFFPLATAAADPTSITVGPDNALWFVETSANKIGRIPTTAAAGTSPAEYPVTTANAGLGVIIAGPDNALWYTETKADKLGRMLTTGQPTPEVALTGVGSPYGLVAGVDGNFYIGDQTKSTIVQYNPTTGAIASFATKTANAGPYWLTLGPDNEVYFTEQTANNIGQFRYF